MKKGKGKVRKLPWGKSKRNRGGGENTDYSLAGSKKTRVFDKLKEQAVVIRSKI